MQWLSVVLLIIAHGCAHQCNWGTSVDYTTCSTTDSCVSALFLDTNTTVYGCGNCSDYTAQNYTTSVACCGSGDFCLPVTAPLPANNSCESLFLAPDCLARADCYWCQTTLFDQLGLCLPVPANTPCWAVQLTVSNSTQACGVIQCAPVTPAYSAQTLTLTFLKDYGLPAVVDVLGDTGARGLGLDVLSRQVRYLNNTYAYCDVDQEVRQWCGVDSTRNFKYCIVSEHWPQSDVWGWLQNTTPGGNTLTPLWPALCACPQAGRAYYIPERSVDQTQHFAAPCGVENTLLAFYILLMLLFCLALVWVLWDVAVQALRFRRKLQQGKGRQYMSDTVATLWVKALIVLYMVTAVATLAQFIAPGSHVDPILNVSKAVMCFLSVIWLLSSFPLACFRYTEILLKANLFGPQTEIGARFMRVFKWAFLASVVLPLLASLGMTGGFAHYMQPTITFSPDTAGELAVDGHMVTVLAQALMCILLAVQLWELLVVGVLQLIVNLKLRTVSQHLKGMHNLMGRNAALLLALLIGVPNWILLVPLTHIVAWQQTGQQPSWWYSTYLGYIGYLWMIWAYFLTGLVWSTATAYAVRTKVKRSVALDRFIAVMGLAHLVGAPSDASKSGSTFSLSTVMSLTGDEPCATTNTQTGE